MNSGSCEMQWVIRFFAKNHKPIETCQQLYEVYGMNIIAEGGLRNGALSLKMAKLMFMIWSRVDVQA